MSAVEEADIGPADVDVSDEHVREERVRSVDRRAHWAYLLVVLVGATLLMVAFMALLDATT
jgi:hypothetical protein